MPQIRHRGNKNHSFLSTIKSINQIHIQNQYEILKLESHGTRQTFIYHAIVLALGFTKVFKVVSVL